MHFLTVEELSKKVLKQLFLFFPSCLNQVVEVVLPSDPAVVGLLTVGLVGDVSGVHAFTVEKLPLEQLQVGQRKAGSLAPPPPPAV